MKSINLVAGAVCVVLLCSPASAEEEEEDECCEGEAFSLPSRGILPDGLLGLLKNALPDLHLTVTSPGWETADGLEQLRTVVKPTLVALDMKGKDVDDYLTRIDSYMAKVPFESKEDVKMAFGLVGKAMLNHFTAVEMMRDGTDTFFDAYSLIYSDSHPDAMAGYKECLDTSIANMETKTRIVFGNWLDQIEQASKHSDTLTINVRAHGDIAKALVGIVHGNHSPSDERVCYAEHLESLDDN